MSQTQEKKTEKPFAVRILRGASTCHGVLDTGDIVTSRIFPASVLRAWCQIGQAELVTAWDEGDVKFQEKSAGEAGTPVETATPKKAGGKKAAGKAPARKAGK